MWNFTHLFLFLAIPLRHRMSDEDAYSFVQREGYKVLCSKTQVPHGLHFYHTKAGKVKIGFEDPA